MHETRIIFYSGTPDDIDAAFAVFGRVYKSNGLTVARMEELEAFFNEMCRSQKWGIIDHIENIKNEDMYTVEEREFLLFLVLGCSFQIVSKNFNIV